MRKIRILGTAVITRQLMGKRMSRLKSSRMLRQLKLLTAYDDTAVPVIYEGTSESEKKFTLRTSLSVRAAAHAQTITISGILDYLRIKR